MLYFQIINSTSNFSICHANLGNKDWIIEMPYFLILLLNVNAAKIELQLQLCAFNVVESSSPEKLLLGWWYFSM